MSPFLYTDRTSNCRLYSEDTQKDAEQTLADVQALGAEAILVQGDLTIRRNIVALFDSATAIFGDAILQCALLVSISNFNS